jgi:hypothetical protein
VLGCYLYHLQGVFEPVYNHFSTTTTCPNDQLLQNSRYPRSLCGQRQLGAYLAGRPFPGSQQGQTGRCHRTHRTALYYTEPGAALALRDISGRSHGRWSPGHGRAWVVELEGRLGCICRVLNAFTGLLAPALKRVRLQFVQYFFTGLFFSRTQEKQSCMACMVRFGLDLSQHVRTRFESFRIYDCAVKLQCAFQPPKKVRTRQHK